MMLHNEDEICKFDACVLDLHRLLIVPDRHSVVRAAGDVMRLLVFHDWPEWGATHRWQIPDSTFEAFEPDDAEFLRRLIIGVVTVLKSDGASGVNNLKTYAATYLRQRGIRVDAAKPETFTAYDVAKFVGIQRTSITKTKTLAWGDPVHGTGAKNSPFEWSREVVTPILSEQWPTKDWSKF